MNPLQRLLSIGTKAFPLGGNRYSVMNSWVTPDDWSLEKEIAAYFANPIAAACIAVIGEEVAKVDFSITTIQGDERKPVKRHPFLKVLDHPHPDITRYEFYETLQTYFEAAGEVFIYMELGESTKLPKSMMILRPELMEVAVDADTGSVTGYIVHRPDGEKIPLDKDEVIHIKYPNPFNRYRGISRLRASRVSVQTLNFAGEYARNFIYNNASPSGVLYIKSKLGDDAWNELQRKWKDKYGNVGNAGKTLFLREAEAKYEKIGLSLNELDLGAVRDFTREDILMALRVPKNMLGIVEDVNYNNGKNSRLNFLDQVIDGKMLRLADAFTPIAQRWKFGFAGEDAEVTYTSPVPDDAEAMLNKHDKATNRWMTINEVRTEQGLPEIGPEGDKLYIPINLIEAGEDGLDSTKGAKAITVTPKKKDLNYEVKENFRLALYKLVARFEKKFIIRSRKLLESQRKEVLANLAGNKYFGAKKRDIRFMVETKAYEDIVFVRDDAVEDFINQLGPIVTELAKEAGQIAFAMASEDDLLFEVDEALRNAINNSVDLMSNSFTDETLAVLKDQLQEALLEGDNLDKIKKRINTVYRDAKGHRTERIARSESSYGANEATMQAYRQSGSVKGKEWFANPGACEFCMALNGTVVGVEGDYVKNGSTIEGVDEDGQPTGNTYTVDYRDVKHPPAHPNCTCTVIPVR